MKNNEYLTIGELTTTYNYMADDNVKVLSHNKDKVADLGYCNHIMKKMGEYLLDTLNLLDRYKDCYSVEEYYKMRNGLIRKYFLIADKILSNIDNILDEVLKDTNEEDITWILKMLENN